MTGTLSDDRKVSLPPPIPYQDAQARLLELAQPLSAEECQLEHSLGRYLAEPLTSRRTQPPGDLSAMDGYAVRSDELSGPWRIVGESAAGHPFGDTLTAGEAVRISTGALMPDGSGAVLLQENAERDGQHLQLKGEDAATPRHIRRIGLDFREGDRLIVQGKQMRAPHIALALSGGHRTAMVRAKPSIAIIDNGDELASDPAQTATHQIPASNGAMLAAMAAPLVSDIKRLGPVPDNQNALADALRQAGDVDVIVTSGGASVGDHDLVRPALEQWGAKLDFWRIAMKPGKPLLVAKRGRQVILGLPGNPVSSFVTSWLFLMPLLRHLAGAAQPLPKPLHLPCSAELPANGPRATFVRAQISQDGVSPISQQDSSALAALALSNALIERSPHAPALSEGEQVPVFPLI